MDIKDITKEALQKENAALFSLIADEAVKAERQRIQDITDLTLEGYEELAEKAKADGTSAMDYQKALAAAQREKRKKFLTDRKNELSPAERVEGGEPADVDKKTNDDSEAKELAQIAQSVHNSRSIETMN